MKKEKWILKEIDSWKDDAIIDEVVANVLKKRYVAEKNTNFLIVLFSIIGTFLIGTGVILIGAKNWYQLPVFLRVAIAFMPLVISQLLAVFVLKYKYESVAWKESVAILNMAGIFTAVAMVGQIFHLSGDFGIYVLTCGLLSLPMIYIFDATSPLIIYYWTVLNWGALDHGPINAIILFVLFSFGVAFVVLNRKKDTAKLAYMTWITLIAGFVAVLIMGSMLGGGFLLIALTYFVLLISFVDLPEKSEIPFKVIGTLGTLISLSILTYRDIWLYIGDKISIGGSIMAGAMIIVSIFFATKVFRKDNLKFTFIIGLLSVCLMRYIWEKLRLDIWPYEFIFTIISNVVLLFVGAGFILHGTKHINLITTNVGMVTLCSLIIMRFFDSDMDFLWRGVVFLILGIGFLLVNLRILHMKKQSKKETVL